MPSFRCPYCARSIPTRGGVNHHISKSPTCHKKWRDSLARDTSFTVEHEEAEQLGEEPELEPVPRTPSPAPSHDDEDYLMADADDFVPLARQATPPPPEPIQRSRRATVEEVLDEDDPQNFQRFVEPFEDRASGRPAAGTPLRAGETLFDRMRTRQKAEGATEFWPFQDGEEWDLAKWLSKNVSQTATEEYLALPIVSQIRLAV